MMDFAALSDEVMDMLPGAVAECGGVKQAAFDLDRAPSTVSNQIHGRDQHRPDLRLVLWVLVNQRSGAVLASLCERAGYDVPRRRDDLTPEEKLERLTSAVRESLGPELAASLLRKAGA